MNKKVRDIFPFFKSPKVKKYASLSLLVVLLIAIPLLVYEVTNLQQTQTIKQHAAWVVPQTQTYYCNSALSVTLSLGGIGNNYSVAESPDCSSGFNKVSSFQSSVIIKQKAGSVGAYAVHWMWAQFWCQDPGTSPCLLNGSDTKEHVVGLDTAQNPTIVAQSDIRQAAAPFTGQACGVYQNDFGFYITDNSDPNKTHLCTTKIIAGQAVPIVLTQSGLGNRNDNASWCNTQTQCVVPSTPTPTTPPAPTATPTLPVATPTPSDTPPMIPSDTPTVIPSDTPADTPTPGLTITPTDTPADTPTGTLTPTNTPTPTLPNQSTNTPVPPTTTPKPTLPPTGPGNVFVSTGLIGAAIVVIGLVFAIGL